jgi:hypothetical protein
LTTKDLHNNCFPCFTKRIEYENADSLYSITFLGDTHIGSSYCDEKTLQVDINTIAENPYARWVGMGDICEWIQRSDPRFATDELASWITTQTKDIAKVERERAVSLLYPIKDKCLGLIEGNHERSIARHNERDVYTQLAEDLELGVESLLGPAGFLRVVFSCNGGKAFTLRIFLTHGWWAGRYYSSNMFPLERLTSDIDADLFVCAHNHQKGAFAVQRFVSDKANNVYQKEILCVNTGCYLYPSAWSRSKGFKPVQHGAKVVDVKPYYKTLRTETNVGL